MIYVKNFFSCNAIVAAVLLLSLVALFTSGVAYGQGPGGGSGGSQSQGTGIQDQDRDRIQDPSTHDGDEPLQDRDQDRDRLQDTALDGDGPDRDRDQDRDQLRDPSLHIGDEPIQDRDQLRDQVRDQLQDPDQDRDRDRIRAEDPEGLRELIRAGEEVGNDAANGLGEQVREMAHNRNRVEVGVLALMGAQNMTPPFGQQISEAAQAVNNAHREMMQEEERIQSRGFLNRLFLGGDNEAAEQIQERVRLNEERMEQIRQYLNDCECDEEVRNMLQEQVQNMEEEHQRLQELAEEEGSRWGLFSWRF